MISIIFWVKMKFSSLNIQILSLENLKLVIQSFVFYVQQKEEAPTIIYASTLYASNNYFKSDCYIVYTRLKHMNPWC